MTNGWKQKYEELAGFINSHPEIEITRTKWSIPEEVKKDFFNFFDSVRVSFVEQYHSSIIKESEAFVASYKEAAAKALNNSSLDGITASLEFEAFLKDPKAALIKPLFNPLYNLTKGKINADDFENTAIDLVKLLPHKLQAMVYEKWIILSLFNLLKPDELYHCYVKKSDDRKKKYRIHMDSKRLQSTPFPVKTSLLSWEFDPMTIITNPDFIIHTSALKNNKYIAIKTNFMMSTHPTVVPSNKREWFPIKTDFKLDEGVILVYIADNPIDICIVSQDEQICRPDLVIKYKARTIGDINQWLDNAQKEAESLQPIYGSFLVSKQPSGITNDELKENIISLDVGLDELKLVPVIQKLFNDEYILAPDTPARKTGCLSGRGITSASGPIPVAEASPSFTQRILSLAKKALSRVFFIFTPSRKRDPEKPDNEVNTFAAGE